MSGNDWKIYSLTEDDYIEFARCVEKLMTAGFDRDEIELKALKCHTCGFCGRCGVTRESPFLGARTC